VNVDTSVPLPLECPNCRKAFSKICSVLVPYVPKQAVGDNKPKKEDDESSEWLDGNNHQPSPDPYEMRDDGSLMKKGGKSLPVSVPFARRVGMFSSKKTDN